MRFSIVTFGCRVNQADSLAIEDCFLSRGAEPAATDAADVVIVNTCSVTASADQGARQAIRRIARENPAAKIVVTGCYATRRPDEVAALPGVARVIANGDKDDLADHLSELTTAERYAGGDGACGGSLHPGVLGRTVLTLRVQTGCEQRCSYCIIPSTRGHSRSRPLSHVLTDIDRAVDAGYKEIVIAGVHLGSYGRDLDDGTTLERLVLALSRHPGNVLFRLSSLEPMDCTRAIVRLVAESERLAPHFHLPLQHGSDAMLLRMRRPYTSSVYRSLLDDIHSRMPHASIGTDVIVGLPGERDEHFVRTIELLEQLPLSHVHVFPYSDRPGTEATGLREKVVGTDIRERGRAVRDVGARLTNAFQARQLGTVRRALTVDDGSRAVTDNYLKVHLEAGRERNEWVNVAIAGEPGGLVGLEVR